MLVVANPRESANDALFIVPRGANPRENAKGYIIYLAKRFYQSQWMYGSCTPAAAPNGPAARCTKKTSWLK